MKSKFLAIYELFKTEAIFLQLQYGTANLGWQPTSGAAYLFFRLLPGPAERVSLGVKHHRTIAVINIEIGVPLMSGEAQALDYADSVAGWFRDTTISGIVCRSPEIIVIGQDGEWHKTVVSVPVYWDETYT